MKYCVIYTVLKTASIILMLFFSISGNAQVYTTILKQSLPLKEDDFGEHSTKFILSDNKVLLLSRKKSSKENGSYSASYLSYDIITGKKNTIKFISDSDIFEYLNISNTHQCIGKDIFFFKVNEYERLNSDIYTSALYIFKKNEKQLYQQIDVVNNYQQFEGKIYQLDESRVVFYKNYDYNSLDDSIPTVTSIYNFYEKKFEKVQQEKFKEIYVTNLVNNLFTVNNNRIYKSYPLENLITVSDDKLKSIDTIRVPVTKYYSEQFSIIDSLKKTIKFKKEFIKEAKKIDYFIERMESIFILNRNLLCVVIKPENSDDFKYRRLLFYSSINNELLSDFIIDYAKENLNPIDKIVPNLTYNDPFILFNESTNSLVYINKNQYLKGNKIKGDNRYYMYVLNFKYDNIDSKQMHLSKQTDIELSSNVIFNLAGDTINIKQLFKKRAVVLVQNNRICIPCNTQAYQIINTQFRNYPKYVLAEYSENKLRLLSEEKRLKKVMKIEGIYYFINNTTPEYIKGLSIPNLSTTPSPFILSKDKSNQIDYLPLNVISNK